MTNTYKIWDKVQIQYIDEDFDKISFVWTLMAVYPWLWNWKWVFWVDKIKDLNDATSSAPEKSNVFLKDILKKVN